VSRAIEDVRLVKPSPDEPRVFAVFLDEYHVSAGASDRVRAAVARFLADEIRPRDLLVVMKPLDSVLTIHATSDRAHAQEAMRTFEGRRGAYEPTNAYERNFMAGVPARIEAARAQVALSAVNALAVHLGTYADQRKTLIVVSEGIGRVERRR